MPSLIWKCCRRSLKDVLSENQTSSRQSPLIIFDTPSPSMVVVVLQVQPSRSTYMIKSN